MKKILNRILSAVTGAMLLMVTGCSAFRPSTQTVNISCAPGDAVLMVNGQRHTPPVQVNVPRNRDLSLQAYKEGYMQYQRTIGHHLNTTGALDAVGTFLLLVPGIGLFFPGAWSLDETDVNITLYQK